VRTKISRRKILATTGAAAIAQVARPAVAQQKPVKIGLMTVKTGGLAAGGVHLEEGISCFLKDKNFTLAGRKIELVVADTAGVPATAKAKAIELVERDNVDLIMGPLAAFENGSPSRIISANTKCRPWDSAAPRISPSGIAIPTKSGLRTAPRSAFIRWPITPARK